MRSRNAIRFIEHDDYAAYVGECECKICRPIEVEIEEED
jgi:hypothetical protein